MAVLSDADRQEIWAKWMRENTEVSGNLTKADLRAAVNAVDVWADSNQASFNTAIPQPARNALTTKQKVRMLMDVVTRRFHVEV